MLRVVGKMLGEEALPYAWHKLKLGKAVIGRSIKVGQFAVAWAWKREGR